MQPKTDLTLVAAAVSVTDKNAPLLQVISQLIHQLLLTV